MQRISKLKIAVIIILCVIYFTSLGYIISVLINSREIVKNTQQINCVILNYNLNIKNDNKYNNKYNEIGTGKAKYVKNDVLYVIQVAYTGENKFNLFYDAYEMENQARYAVNLLRETNITVCYYNTILNELQINIGDINDAYKASEIGYIITIVFGFVTMIIFILTTILI